jgi:hypothetical protein
VPTGAISRLFSFLLHVRPILSAGSYTSRLVPTTILNVRFPSTLVRRHPPFSRFSHSLISVRSNSLARPSRASRVRLSDTSTSKYPANQPSRDFSSNLSGLFFFLDPLSAVGLLIAQVVGQIPYLLLGFTWGLSKKHEGTDA